jgi:hypothetical protein
MQVVRNFPVLIISESSYVFELHLAPKSFTAHQTSSSLPVLPNQVFADSKIYIALALSGEAATPGLLALTQGFTHEKDYLVWSQILGSLGTVKSVFSEDTAVVGGLKKFILKLITPAVEKM